MDPGVTSGQYSSWGGVRTHCPLVAVARSTQSRWSSPVHVMWPATITDHFPSLLSSESCALLSSESCAVLLNGPNSSVTKSETPIRGASRGMRYLHRITSSQAFPVPAVLILRSAYTGRTAETCEVNLTVRQHSKKTPP